MPLSCISLFFGTLTFDIISLHNYWSVVNSNSENCVLITAVSTSNWRKYFVSESIDESCWSLFLWSSPRKKFHNVWVHNLNVQQGPSYGGGGVCENLQHVTLSTNEWSTRQISKLSIIPKVSRVFHSTKHWWCHIQLGASDYREYKGPFLAIWRYFYSKIFWYATLRFNWWFLFAKSLYNYPIVKNPGLANVMRLCKLFSTIRHDPFWATSCTYQQLLQSELLATPCLKVLRFSFCSKESIGLSFCIIQHNSRLYVSTHLWIILLFPSLHRS